MDTLLNLLPKLNSPETIISIFVGFFNFLALLFVGYQIRFTRRRPHLIPDTSLRDSVGRHMNNWTRGGRIRCPCLFPRMSSTAFSFLELL